MSVEVAGLSFSYGAHAVLEDISFSARAGELLSILGPNGVGKSTLFRCILGLLKGWRGEIRLAGEDIKTLSARSLAKRVAYIPQQSYPAFQYSVFDMVLMGTAAHSPAFATPGKREEAAARAALERLDIADLGPRNYARLSGGEKQLVLIARALAQESRVLLMDEPTANLDYGNRLKVLDRVRALAGEGYTVLQTTHEPEQAYQFSHRLLCMKNGRVLAQGEPRDVLTSDLIRALYGVEVEVESLRNDTLRVCVPIDNR